MNTEFVAAWPRAIRKRPIWRVGVPLLLVAATSVGAHLIDHDVARRYLFLTYYPSLLLSAWLGGFVSGLVALVSAQAIVWGFWFAHDPGGLDLSLGGLAPVAVSLATGIALSFLMEQLHRTFERLEAALARERHESATKDTFLASLSHELRTPINVVLGRAQMLRALMPDPRWRHGLDAITRNAQAQSRLIEQLLDSQRIVHERLDLRCDVLHLDEVTRAVLDDLAHMAEQGGVFVTTRLEPVAMWGDAERLRQVVRNLVGNAIKFTPTGGRVTLSVRREGHAAVVDVEDTGAGFSEDFAPYLFERFRQAEPFRTGASQRGLGLGLAIVKAIVEAHDGRVTGTSQGPARGARFVVRLPVGPLAEQPRFVGASAGPVASAARRGS